MASARTLPWYLDSSCRPEWLQRFLTSGGGHVTIWYSMQLHLKDLEGYVLDLKGQTIYYIYYITIAVFSRNTWTT